MLSFCCSSLSNIRRPFHVWKKPPSIGVFSTRVASHRVQSRRLSPVLCQKNKCVVEFHKLLNKLQSAFSSNEPPEDQVSTNWLNDIQSHGRILAKEVENLQTSLSQKSSELTRLKHTLREMKDSLKLAEELQTTKATQLEVKTTEVEMLRNELTELQNQRSEEVNASMERYRELEAALAHVESELESNSEIFQSRDCTSASSSDSFRVSEIVQEQDKALQNLKESLKTATEDKQRAVEEAEEARRNIEELVSAKETLEQEQEVLSKELSQLQIQYAESEIGWNSELQSVQDLCAKLKEDTVNLESIVTLRDDRVASLEESFSEVKSQLDKSECKSLELRKEYAKLRQENETLRTQISGSGQDPRREEFAALQVKLTRMEITVPKLEDEIRVLLKKLKTMEADYQSMEKDYHRTEKRCVELEEKTGTLKNLVEEKSNLLVSAHKEKRSLKAEVVQLEHENNNLHSRIQSALKDVNKFKDLSEQSKQDGQKMEEKYQEQISNMAEKYQEAQNVILYHQKNKNENGELQQTINELTAKLNLQQEELQRVQSIRGKELEQIQSRLDSTEEALTAKEAQIMSLETERVDLQNQLSQAKDSAKEQNHTKDSRITELEAKIQELDEVLISGQSSFQELKNEMTKLQNELSTRQRIITARDQEIVTLKDDAESANERVEALRRQISSLQTVNREMETKKLETDSAVSALNDQMKALQNEGHQKDQQITNLNQKVSELETKSKQTIEQFGNQVNSLEEFSKQQEELVETYFNEKQKLESIVGDLRTQLEAQRVEKTEAEKLVTQTQALCAELQTELEKSHTEMKSVRQSAAQEIAEAERILEKAESVAASVQGSIEEVSATNGTVFTQSKETELRKKISELEFQLRQETESNLESENLTKKLEVKVVDLQEELRRLKESKGADSAKNSDPETDLGVQNELISVSERLSKSMAAEEAAVAEIDRLRAQIRDLEALNRNIDHDGRFAELQRQAMQLRKENESLRNTANKRNQILAQSRHFIEQYLERSVTSLNDFQS
eukprot:g4121.t1